ncbi:unnamed protein product [Trichogramma brassicae]|uniref:Uncharacterized protein n=1 Tax=Trichogramma brassicae TaxID=86971 RepID=A0A6H5HXC7_9HYME|nr:unnamed protein product [Trichogramma brassicae]
MRVYAAQCVNLLEFGALSPRASGVYSARKNRYEFPCVSNSYDHDPSRMWSSEIECEIIFSPREQCSKIIVKIIDLQEDRRARANNDDITFRNGTVKKEDATTTSEGEFGVERSTRSRDGVAPSGEKGRSDSRRCCCSAAPRRRQSATRESVCATAPHAEHRVHTYTQLVQYRTSHRRRSSSRFRVAIYSAHIISLDERLNYRGGSDFQPAAANFAIKPCTRATYTRFIIFLNSCQEKAAPREERERRKCGQVLPPPPANSASSAIRVYERISSVIGAAPPKKKRAREMLLSAYSCVRDRWRSTRRQKLRGGKLGPDSRAKALCVYPAPRTASHLRRACSVPFIRCVYTYLYVLFYARDAHLSHSLEIQPHLCRRRAMISALSRTTRRVPASAWAHIHARAVSGARRISRRKAHGAAARAALNKRRQMRVDALAVRYTQRNTLLRAPVYKDVYAHTIAHE